MAGSRLVLTEAVHAMLREHLFPGDGKEAAAILLCNRVEGSRLKLLAKELILVPHDECKSRTINSITWPGSYLEKAIDQAEPDSMSIILVHSHPGGFLAFSDLDDQSDEQTMLSLYLGVEAIHGSAIMVSTGEMRARLYEKGKHCRPLELVTVAGDDIHYWWNGTDEPQQPTMAFTSGMTETFGRLTVAVIGVSGTGSIVAEQLTRLGFGELILVDHDHVEEKNLNRILNSTFADALAARSKVEMFSAAVERIRGDQIARPIHNTLRSREAILAVAEADLIFSCVDTHRGRLLADLISSAFLIPLFDVGVRIPTHVKGSAGRVITDVVGRIDYVKPGGSTLSDRGIYTPESLQQEALHESDPGAYADQLERGYISGIQEEAPSVITLNMRAASACVSELIARTFPFREDDNSHYAQTIFSLAGCEEDYFSESRFTKSPNQRIATGCKEPLLGIPDLGAR
ncbi:MULTISPECIES: ThiF family adenylyltransferase [unclassified Pseudomonas]|uniref:ThiF family adenylyltransferase n=1 Tax=unclassified Pseudomonas TaxID=196821 RepID=UPI0024479679|nr:MULTISPECIES: ThiF family adenylyltransferase [unclassified Pseudomonas]MDG9927969.1 ThiF family adenylyltransferase [Pseudomonas sp. GD04042]MDH0481978.1 ThiF family adenylyltransferase [Pseudomonas sp. GD04015]MDH0604127.1 ThiF family adenylyltransferase [Pseudomonas sp. GD03869]